MSSKWGRRLAGLAAAGALAGLGLVSAGAGTAMATTSPGTTGPGSWSFGTFLNSEGQAVYHEGITHASAQPTVSYTAQVQQPINADGSSIFSNKSRTIPVKFTVQKCTTPGASTDHYPGLLQSTADPTLVPGANSDVGATNLNWTPPGSLTVGQVTNLTADFTWLQGQNHTGSMYWIIHTVQGGNVWVYYGDITGTGVYTGTSGSGDNMITLGGARAEATQLGYYPQYDTLANILAGSAPGGGTIADMPVQWIGLAVDEGNQAVQLQDVTIGTSVTSDTTYTPGDVSSGGGQTTCAPDTTDPMYVYLAMGSSTTPIAGIDEAIVSTQGDTGGAYRQVDGKYMYNFPVANLPDKNATYWIGISPVKDGTATDVIPSPVEFGLK